MYTLNRDLKRRDLPDHIREGLAPYPVFQTKFLVSGFTFLMLDLMIILPLLFPVIKLVLFITLPLMLIMSIWAIWILVRKPENTQMETLLFLGYLGIVGSFCYFVVAMKYNYMVGIESPFYYIVMFLIYLTAIYFSIKNERKKYSALEVQPGIKTPNWHYILAVLAPGAGYLAIHYIMGLSENIVLSFMSAMFLIFSGAFIFLLARMFHRYIFIKKNIHLVRFANKELNQKPKSTKVGN